MILYLIIIPTSALLSSVIFVSVLYFHYGIDGWDDLVREVQILRAKVAFARSQSAITRRKVNYVSTWKCCVAKFGDNVFLLKENSTYTYNQVTWDLYTCIFTFDLICSSHYRLMI